MAITVQSRAEIRESLRAIANCLRPELSLSLDTDEGALLETLVEAVFGAQVNARAIEADLYPATAAALALVEHAKTRLATNPLKPAVGSAGTAALRCSGTAGATISQGTPLAHADGTRYQVDGSYVIGGGGTVDVDVAAISTGTGTNKTTGETLTFETPPTGVASDAVLVADLTDGADIETYEELRVRLQLAFEDPPASGRFSDYQQWALEVPGVVAAYVYGPSSVDLDGRRGKGTVDVAILTSGSGSARIPSAALQTAVQDHLEDEAPELADHSVLLPAADTEDVDVQIEADEWDWTGSGVVGSWDGGAHRLYWVGTLPASLEAAIDAGDQPRIMCEGQVLTCTGHDVDVMPYTVIAETPSPAPSNPDPIYAAGPRSALVQVAITELFEALGPARGTAAAPEQQWNATLRVAAIYDVVMDVTGVTDAAVVTPVANVTPVDHGAGGTVDLLVPGELTVRPM